MGLERTQINETTWMWMEDGVRFFLLTGTKKALLIDSGMMTRNAKELAQELTDLPLELLSTHADGDHVGSNPEFDSFYMAPEDVKQYADQHPDHKFTVKEITGGTVIDLGERELEIISLPGHTPGSVGILDKNTRILFSGDPVQQHGNIFMFGPGRDMPVYIESLKKLEKRTSEFDLIYPSHADCPLTAAVIRPLIEGAEKILAGYREGEHQEMFGFKTIRVDFGFCAFIIAE